MDAAAAILVLAEAAPARPARASTLFADLARTLADVVFAAMAEARGLPAPAIAIDPILRADALAALGALPERPEDQGSIHEALLELTPRLDRGRLRLEAERADRSRRASGSYFTPPDLVAELLDRALPESLGDDYRVLDPSSGAGHVLLATARRLIARGMDRERALRSIRGVDVSADAARLCRRALWLEAGDATLPLDAFDEAIRVADALRDPIGDGFDLVVGNPPWIAHAGRAAQPLPERTKARYLRQFEAFLGYPTTHGLFVTVAARALREDGRLALVLPASVSELAGYAPTRRAHDRLMTIDRPLIDFGEGRFAGVTQPSMALVSRRVAGGRADGAIGAPWPMERPDLDAIGGALLARWSSLAPLPAKLFAERGLQSDRSIAGAFATTDRPRGRFRTPIREGSDVREFELKAPRKHVDRVIAGARLRSDDEFREVGALVRQTARFPIAALSDGLPFRNSLLGVIPRAPWTAPAIVALLNSSLVRWAHHHRFRDARQPVLPQVKIGHLRAIPAPPTITDDERARLDALGRRPDRAALDALVARLYALSAEEIALVDRWASEKFPAPRRKNS